MGHATKEDEKCRIAEFRWFHYWRKVVYCRLPEIYRGKMLFEVKFQVQIRQKCRSKWNNIRHTVE